MGRWRDTTRDVGAGSEPRQGAVGKGSQLGPTPIQSKGRTRRLSKIPKFIFGRH